MALSGLRGRLHAPGALYLAQTMFPDPGVAGILGGCGFDFVMVDAEHGPFTLESLRGCLEALKSTSTPAVVRTASHSETEIKQVLDLGADGVMIPKVENTDQAEGVVRAARYAPDGIRGVSRAVRAASFGRNQEYFTTANAQIAVIAIIESAVGVQNIEQIVRTPGLDGVMVGGDDLAADLGLYGQYEDPRLRDAMECVIAASIAAGLKVGARAPRTQQERESMLIHCGNDAMVLRASFEQALAEQRASSQKIALSTSCKPSHDEP